MRPITLKMAGLRSYRTERTIDFGGPGLIAVIGDTGAGKSSILEALTGALYGACTWDNRGIGELISDGAQTVQLELTFAVAGQTWTVSRSASRNNYPPSRHLLHCHDTGEKLTGDRAVTGRVTGLLGLDTKQFLRVVVLPQNRFMELLNARRGERNTILKGIFRLEDLDRVRQAADALRDDLEPKLTQVRLARARLAEDPASRLAAAEARRSSAEQDRAGLQQVRDQVTVRQVEIAALDHAAGELRASLEQLAAARSHAGDVGQVLTAVAGSAAELDARAVTLAGQRSTLEAREAAAQQALDAAVAAGEDAAALAAAGQALGSLADSVPALVTAQHALTAQDSKLARQASDTAALRRELQAKTTELDEATTALSPLQEEASRAQHACDEARETLTTLGQALASATRAAGHTGQQYQSLADLRGSARDAAARSERAARDAHEAEAALLKTQRRNSAAHAAEGCQPGDPCPVCDRPLPETFTPPAAADEAAATARTASLRAAALQADRVASTAAEQARRAGEDLANAVELETAALAALAGAASAVSGHADAIPATAALAGADAATASATLAAGPVTREPAAVRGAAGDLAHNPLLDRADSVPAARRAAASLVTAASGVMTSGIDRLIEPLTRRAAELTRQHEQAEIDRDQLGTVVAGLRAQAAERARALEREREQLLARCGELVTDANRVAGQLAALPPIAADVAQAASLTSVPLAALTPWADRDQAAAEPDPRAETTVELPAAGGDEFAASFKAVIGKVIARLDETRRKLEGHQQDLREARQELSNLSLSEQNLASGRAASVTRPVRQVAAALQTVHTRAADLRRALTQATGKAGGDQASTEAGLVPPHPPYAEEVITADQAAVYRSATAAFLAAAGTLTANAGDVLVSLDESATAQRQAITEALASFRLADLSALQQTEIDAATRWEVADRDARRLRAEKPVAAALDTGIAEAAVAVAVLRAVAKALTSTQFVDFVIARRSTALLLVASRLLGQLTGDGYGFTEDFQIIDRRTRAERDVKTLSGGETFLASLALALGLVELAGRSGGRIDSLFLDEGFGSLDTTILAEALDVLRSHVSTGRLVTVISHLHAVAADLDRVLLVTKNPTGSDIRWLQAAEREELLLDDVSAGLLS
jgi:exonuclease SbcC